MEKAAVDLAKQHGPYYYAHAAKAWEVPEDAKTISGEGLTHTGQGPRRLDGAAATVADAPADESMEGLRAEVARLRARLADAARVRRPETSPLKKYAFADGEETCKIYIEFAAGELRARRTEEDGSARHCLDAGVVASFERRRVRVVVVVPDAAGDDSRREFAVNLACDIVPKHCSYKVVAEKNRVVVSLRKAEAVPWPTLACAAP
ncbi:unnamed protein product [Pelagomonas calceolata]|uniref:CS domain-containing protein n=1 Tax=Pelagomonas calceolata TaxID=35677 RepID=A0A8J2WTI4_9STRA|nr:unnamed protein product [Pelagomonas calceolata]|mmetsp:Transcript_12419/g.36414  ORF Transcript_12419/g.36414 Transcript_12419/m.36414 type:complete len:206 (+) Transcript_12419:127-744(+)